ncbi:MAG: hydrogen peroxide-inducible genes activator [Sphingorhabdus sp.]
MPTLRQLQYLVAVADLKHFGRAAIAVNVSQPTLSQQLQTLEARLGVVLIERRLGGVQLTPIGRDIAERARAVLVKMKDIEHLARQAQADVVGTIRLGVTPTLGPYLLPAIVAALHHEYPSLRLYIREGIPADQLDELSRGTLDLLLAPLPLNDPSLTVEPLFREPLHLIAPPDHPLARATHPVAPDNLQGIPILSLEARHHLHAEVKALCEHYGMMILRDYEGTSLDTLRQMVGSGLGLSILPEIYIRSEVGGAAGIRLIPVKAWTAKRSIAAAWRSDTAFAPHYANISERVRSAAMTLLQEPLTQP